MDIAKIYYKVIRAVETREPELLNFANLVPEDSCTLLDHNLFDHINNVEGRGFA